LGSHIPPKTIHGKNITHFILFAIMFSVYFLMGTSMITLVIYMNESGMRDLIVYAVTSFPLSMVISPLIQERLPIGTSLLTK
ncbi:hypothetical protein, partial [Photobacterium sanctipauli]